MAITLWGRISSANVQKVRWALAELGLAYEHIPVGGKYGGNREPAYLALNPNGLVPTLRDGDLVLWESHAILRYLAATYGAGSLWPESPSARAIVDQWTDWTATTFQPAWIGAFWQVVRTPNEQQSGRHREIAGRNGKVPVDHGGAVGASAVFGRRSADLCGSGGGRGHVPLDHDVHRAVLTSGGRSLASTAQGPGGFPGRGRDRLCGVGGAWGAQP